MSYEIYSRRILHRAAKNSAWLQHEPLYSLSHINITNRSLLTIILFVISILSNDFAMKTFEVKNTIHIAWSNVRKVIIMNLLQVNNLDKSLSNPKDANYLYLNDVNYSIDQCVFVVVYFLITLTKYWCIPHSY